MAIQMTMAEVVSLSKRAKGVRSPQEILAAPAESGGRKSNQKYGNTKVTDQGMVFDSKAEHKRWLYLRQLERLGELKELCVQVSYELIPPQVAPSGKKIRPTHYLADFVYLTAKGEVVVEDVKGAVTPEFRLKRKLMLLVHGIEVQEVRS